MKFLQCKAALLSSVAILLTTASLTPNPVIAKDKVNFENALEAQPLQALPKQVEIVEMPVPLPLPEQLKAAPKIGKMDKVRNTVGTANRIENANQSARVQPESDGFVNAIQQYPYTDGALYQVYAAPGKVTEIALQEGEQLVGSGPVAAGDTVRWIIGDTISGAGPNSRVHILVKPTRSDLKTNMIINTNRRTYHLELTANRSTYMASISWNYPQDALIALHATNAQNAATAPVATGIDLSAINFRYKLKGDKPDWRPIRVFDDGVRVFVEFPESISQGDMPPIFVIGKSGQGELVNFRVSGRHLIVDRLFVAAELRLGDKKSEQKVRIIRNKQSTRK
ncbi:P-type conjugative transfer protein TrbG [Sphingorhabdus sp. YGSMI21]|uniref:P-type conjugative transfer protein TrbG n=1 Tax=Sphingorhabdus sp. YGSMI21 TaxID=2077182 RepID=UPI000C1E5A4D|nr:P-type conjugative transfer protein TrbG [Sphingorhabdus sp. YGSMI21]ATW05281.1 P-type conjugative transfer protein TrbG [Sphingorhabdus sp. YGSMI21]